MQNPECYQMKEHHQQVLQCRRGYLLHNLRLGEELWSALLSRGVLSPEMIEEIKANPTSTQQVGALLNVLPARGPSAFDEFCDALLECDHAHVAECLKTTEVTDQFREDIRRQMSLSELPDGFLEKFVNIFKKSTPTMQRFAERKFEVLLEEQENDMKRQENELLQLQNKNTKLQLEVAQLQSFFNSCVDVSDTIASEVQKKYPSKHFLNEEIHQMAALRAEVEKSAGNELASQFYTNMETILKFFEKHMYAIIASLKPPSQTDYYIQLILNTNMPLAEKVQSLVSGMSQFIQDIADCDNIPGAMIKNELEKVLKFTDEIHEGVTLIQQVFRSTLKKQRTMEADILSLLHNFQEIRRLEREVKEKRMHINELSKQGQLMKKKTRHHRRELEHIQMNVNQKKVQLHDVQGALERQLNSADSRLRQMLQLLPDRDKDDPTRSDTDSIMDTTSTIDTDEPCSLSGSFPRYKSNGQGYKLGLPQNISKDFTKPTYQEDNRHKDPGEDDALENPPDTDSVATVESKRKEILVKETKDVTWSKHGVTGSGLPYKSKMSIPMVKVSSIPRHAPKVTNTKNVKTELEDSQLSSRGHSNSTSTVRISNPYKLHTSSEVLKPGRDSSDCNGNDINQSKGLSPRDEVKDEDHLTTVQSGSGQKRERDNSSQGSSTGECPQPSNGTTLTNRTPRNNPLKVQRKCLDTESNLSADESNEDEEDMDRNGAAKNGIKCSSSGIQYQYVTKPSVQSNAEVLRGRAPVPRENYRFVSRNPITDARVAPSQSSAMTKLHLAAANISHRGGGGIHVPQTATTMSRQTSFIQSYITRNEDGFGEPLSPHSKKSLHRQALNTRKVELKLPSRK